MQKPSELLAYPAQGCAMHPASWSLKNHRAGQPQPRTDISSRVVVGVALITTSLAEAGPAVAVLVGLGLCSLVLVGVTEAHEVFHPYPAVVFLCKGHRRLAEDVDDAPDNTLLSLLQAFEGSVPARLLQPAPPGSVAAADMPDPAEAQNRCCPPCAASSSGCWFPVADA